VILIRKPVDGVTAAMLARFVSRARRSCRVAGEVTVLVASNAELRRLNRQFRGKDYPTDVLSFSSSDADHGSYSGDIAISADMARQNGKLLGHGAAEEIKILILHGLLHLAGYDHESDDGAMARRELRLRRQLKLPEGLTERAAGSDSPRSSKAAGVRKTRGASVRRSRQR